MSLGVLALVIEFIQGVWQAGRVEVGAAVTAALKTGYRHFDDAWIYRVSISNVLSHDEKLMSSKNEEEVGQAIKESGVPREEIWITSKVGP